MLLFDGEGLRRMCNVTLSMYHHAYLTILMPEIRGRNSNFSDGGTLKLRASTLYKLSHHPLFCPLVYGKNRKICVKVLHFARTFGSEVRTKYKFFKYEVGAKYKKSSDKIQKKVRANYK